MNKSQARIYDINHTQDTVKISIVLYENIIVFRICERRVYYADQP